jgi:hypothetical protein
VGLFLLYKSTLKQRITNMLNRTIQALDTLTDYPELSEYIKNFNGKDGFMYTIETDPLRNELSKQMGNILDPTGVHSGSSWGCMLREIQAVLNGTITREMILQKFEEEKRIYEEFMAEHNKIILKKSQLE